jgi:hypothetical protein
MTSEKAECMALSRRYRPWCAPCTELRKLKLPKCGSHSKVSRDNLRLARTAGRSLGWPGLSELGDGHIRERVLLHDKSSLPQFRNQLIVRNHRNQHATVRKFCTSKVVG